ncbi:MAG: glycosyltransferase family 4 protein [Chloroflexi bacterium]|nr:glycosyltransferase family 4 protein [Chloroflexota bacterium]
MKLLILCESFPPEINSISSLYGELVIDLSEKGHEIRVVTRTPRTYLAEGVSTKSPIDDLPGVTVKRIRILPAKRSLMPVRIIEQLTTAGRMYLEGVLGFKPDTILVYSPPLPYILPAILLRWTRRSKIVLNVQDLYPQTAIDLGYFKNPVLRKMSRSLETLAYRSSTHIIVHSDGNKRFIVRRGVPETKISAIPNWIDTGKIRPLNRSNEFSDAHRLGDKFVVSFAGVMGLAQGLDVVLNAAETLKNDDQILFVLVGDGAMKARIERTVNERRLINVKMLPMQPPEIYPQILAASDICLVTLDSRLKTPVVPGKLQAIMASGRPVLAAVPADGDVPRIIQDADCGVVVGADDGEGMASAIQSMMKDATRLEEMGNNGRTYAEKHFAKSSILNQFTSKLIAHSSSL